MSKYIHTRPGKEEEILRFCLEKQMFTHLGPSGSYILSPSSTLPSRPPCNNFTTPCRNSELAMIGSCCLFFLCVASQPCFFLRSTLSNPLAGASKFPEFLKSGSFLRPTEGQPRDKSSGLLKLPVLKKNKTKQFPPPKICQYLILMEDKTSYTSVFI